MKIRYEVTENNEVFAWDDDIEQTQPFLHQPHNQNGVAFSNRREAQDWADSWYQNFIAATQSGEE